MGKEAEIKRALIEALGVNPNLPITATVVSVEGRTCTVKLVSDLVLSDVRLCATINQDEDGFVVVPKIGSEIVMISQTGKLSGLMILKVDAVEKIQYKLGDLELTADGTTGKLTLKKDGANFGLLINELITTLSAAQIITPNGPGTISPSTQGQLEAIKTKFNSILNTV